MVAFVKLLLATIARRNALTLSAKSLVDTYLERSQRFTPTEHRLFPTEAALLQYIDTTTSRTRPALILTDSTGKLLTSQELASTFRLHQDAGTQTLLLAIGPADGWSPTALQRADLTISFGRITLPHELAAVVAAEQLYRALTILAGHPYHHGH
jgi:23S rRNA (pseudouridine1915-N3)-methyltransferase